MTKRLTFLDHLEELRKHLLVSLVAIGVCSVAAYFFSRPLLDFLTAPLLKLSGQELYFHAPYEAFVAHLKVSLLTGVLAASPVYLAQLWLFAAPGLYQNEKKVLLPLAFISVVLFLLGAAFAFWIVVPFGLKFLLSYQTYNLRPLLGIDPYFSFLIGMILAFGVVFDLPIVILGLVWAKVFGAGALRSSRKLVIVSIFVLAATLTPSPDPFGQIMLALPLILLYELCIGIAGFIEKRRK